MKIKNLILQCNKYTIKKISIAQEQNLLTLVSNIALKCLKSIQITKTLIQNLGNIKSSTEPYEISTPLGRGKYSEVHEGIDSRNDWPVVIKILKPVRESKIYWEIKILKALDEHPNIIKLHDYCIDDQSATPSFIFEHFSSTTLKNIERQLSLQDIKYIVYQICSALVYCHSKGIMHRDIKPSNIIIDPNSKSLKIIDWGLSDFYFPKKPFHTRVSSRPFKGPELLLDYKYYDFSMDVWSLGCVLAGLMFRLQYLFVGKDAQDQLFEIVKVLGREDLNKYIQKYKIDIDEDMLRQMPISKKISFERFINEENEHLVTAEGLDLLQQMLQYDHEKRITMKEALMHKFFLPREI